MGITRQDSS